MNVLDILKSNGAVTVGSLAASGATTFVQRAYNDLNNGIGAVIVLTPAGSAMQASLQESFADSDTNVSVMVCNETKRDSTDTKSVKDLVGAFERRNARNEKHAKNTYGNVSIPADGGIYNEAGDIVGFVVEAA